MSLVRVLGVDPGTIRTGWGVVERTRAGARCVAAGVIKSPEKDALELRLSRIFEELERVLADHVPSHVAVEDVFFAKHANAALKLGHARGVALVVVARAGLVVTPYPPAVVKRAIAGRGSADKSQVAQMVRAILGLKELPPVDATDALAVAITHLHAVRAHMPQAR